MVKYRAHTGELDSEESSGRIVVGHLEDSRGIAAKIIIQGPLKKDPHETSKQIRSYGTAYHPPIKGKAKVTLQAENDAKIETWIHVVNGKIKQSFPGKADAIPLGIVQLNLKGAETEVVKNVIHSKRIRFSRWHCLWWRNTTSNQQKDAGYH